MEDIWMSLYEVTYAKNIEVFLELTDFTDALRDSVHMASTISGTLFIVVLNTALQNPLAVIYPASSSIKRSCSVSVSLALVIYRHHGIVINTPINTCTNL